MAYKYYFFYNILCVIILQSFAKQLSLRLNIQPFAEYAVAPYVGAWIETLAYHPGNNPRNVAPYVGAWIETSQMSINIFVSSVAPYVGAWIETFNSPFFFAKFSVAPYVGAWIETSSQVF